MADAYYTGIEYFSKNDRLFVTKKVGNDPDEVLELIDPKKGLYRFKQNAVAYVEKLHPNRLTVRHLHFVRRWQHKVEITIETDAHMRTALENLTEEGKGPQRICVHDGIRHVITFEGEIFFHDYGSYGWIVNKKDVEWIRQSLQPLKDSGTLTSMWIGLEKSNWCILKTFSKEPSDKDRKKYFFYRIDYDEGSLRIVTIVSDDAVYLRILRYSETGFFKVGKRLPRTFRPKR
ncbi:TPA: hypothetical protein GX533_03280 [Candidatus Dojkabacteria bacterium]|jgi:hypothetical protein|uniref:Uncharacterized protein n=1 Tax=Candidatus Dojkabacteria bacterium TaxID=2099670 RepID=A0A832QCK4_9BACT|nr:hypothetical protein [Candidatus Dojkabacteria bacterium]